MRSDDWYECYHSDGRRTVTFAETDYHFYTAAWYTILICNLCRSKSWLHPRDLTSQTVYIWRLHAEHSSKEKTYIRSESIGGLKNSYRVSIEGPVSILVIKLSPLASQLLDQVQVRLPSKYKVEMVNFALKLRHPWHFLQDYITRI